jgi:hypothetical protein
MPATNAEDIRAERRLRRGLRLFLYPMLLALLALAWAKGHGDTAT